jgi:hypothetical protein
VGYNALTHAGAGSGDGDCEKATAVKKATMIIRSGSRTFRFLAAVAGLILSQAGCKDSLAPESSSTRTDVFPLAVGAQWVYDFTYWSHRDDGLVLYWHNNWWRGTQRFTVLSVSDAGAEWRWIIRQEDDLAQVDTTWSTGSGYTIKPETHHTGENAFSMYEGKTGLHPMRNDSCSAIWLVPWPYHGLLDPQNPKYDYNLTRYAESSGDTVIYQKPESSGNRILESRTLVGNIGLVQCQMTVYTGNNTPSWGTWWGTLRSYTPGQGAGATSVWRR